MNRRAVRAKIRIVAVGQKADDGQGVQGRFVAARFIRPVALRRLGADEKLHGLDIHVVHFIRHDAGGAGVQLLGAQRAGIRSASNSHIQPIRR